VFAHSAFSLNKSNGTRGRRGGTEIDLGKIKTNNFMLKKAVEFTFGNNLISVQEGGFKFGFVISDWFSFSSLIFFFSLL
jgi:hypothetical protein